MFVSILFIYFIIFKTTAPQCSSYHIVPHYSHWGGSKWQSINTNMIDDLANIDIFD